MKHPSSTTSRRLTVIELNEFSETLLHKACAELDLPHFSRMLEMQRCKTRSPDRREHHGLDPWVQWASIHTGQPSDIHGILRHGDVSRLSHPQIWERLGAAGIRCGLWGLMNATRNGAAKCAFFLPDPWTYEESGHPAELSGLLSLPRYFAKNYLSPKKGEMIRHGLRTLSFLLHPARITKSFGAGFASLPTIFKCGLNAHSMAIAFDILATKLFLAYRRRKDPEFSMIFLNLLAHCQHHFWRREGWHPAMKAALSAADGLIGEILAARRPGEAIMILNGLTQENVDGDGYCIYRQKDPARLLRDLDIRFQRVEACMTNDCHILFDTPEEADAALEKLGRARIGDKPLFHAERNQANPRQIFYQIEYWERVDPNARISVGNEEFPFAGMIELICERTGSHIPEGTLFAQGLPLPDAIDNHAVFDLILGYYSLPARPVEDMEAAAAHA